jgi:hypothetical protein
LNSSSMKQMARTFILLLFLFCATASILGEDGAKEWKSPIRYLSLEVAAFRPGLEIDIPADYLSDMTRETVQLLKESGHFIQVLNEGERLLGPPKPNLKLTGTVTHFTPGSRVERMAVGFGAGSTIIRAHIQLRDRLTGQLVYEQDVDGKVIVGMGSSKGATRGVAKEIAKVIDRHFF